MAANSKTAIFDSLKTGSKQRKEKAMKRFLAAAIILTVFSVPAFGEIEIPVVDPKLSIEGMTVKMSARAEGPTVGRQIRFWVTEGPPHEETLLTPIYEWYKELPYLSLRKTPKELIAEGWRLTHLNIVTINQWVLCFEK